METIVLIGFMGAGKTTVAAALSEQLNQPYVDLDQQLETAVQEPLAAYFARVGEAQFREKEHAMLGSFLARRLILATGGGVITLAKNRALLQRCSRVVYLNASFDTLFARILQDKTTLRPLAQSEQALFALFQERQKLYEASANYIIHTDARPPREIAQAIRDWLTHLENKPE